jgi:hypothetical protein
MDEGWVSKWYRDDPRGLAARWNWEQRGSVTGRDQREQGREIVALVDD